MDEWAKEYLDDNGDVPPPWAVYPAINRYSIGWRMGSGEGAMIAVSQFLEDLEPGEAARLAYLKRHPAAPYTWADWIDGSIFHPGDWTSDWLPNNPVAKQRHIWLLQHGLLASDIAYPTWLSQQQGPNIPWESGPPDSSPWQSARYNTREFAFQSRQIGTLCTEPPPAWRFAAPISPDQGLLCLAQQLLLGKVQPPWEFGLSPADFLDTFEESMGYVDAFRLWAGALFDDALHYQGYLESVSRPPEPWIPWLQAHIAPAF